MANELDIDLGAPAIGWTVYGVVFDESWNGTESALDTAHTVWNGTAFVTDSWAARASGAVTMTDATAVGHWLGDCPAAITTAGLYQYLGYHRLGGSPAPQTDQGVLMEPGDFNLYASAGLIAGTAGRWRCFPASDPTDPPRLTMFAADVRRFGFDLGDMEEIANGESITSATLAGSGITIAGTAIGPYWVLATFSGGTSGTTVTITMTAQMSGGGTIVRQGVLVIN